MIPPDDQNDDAGEYGDQAEQYGGQVPDADPGAATGVYADYRPDRDDTPEKRAALLRVNTTGFAGLPAWVTPEMLQAQQAMPPVPETWTQADTIALQKYQNAVSVVQGQVADGTLHPEEGQDAQQQILGVLAPLAARQERVKQRAVQQQQDEMQQQAAMAAGMEHSEAIYRASGFADRVATFTDSLTGNTAHLVEDKNGRWRELRLGDDDADAGGAQTVNQVAPTPGQWAASQAVGFGGTGGDTQAADGQTAAGGATAQAPQVQPDGAGGHVMTIINGPNVERYRFAPDGTTRLIDRQGPRFDQQQGNGLGGIPGMLVQPHEATVLWDRANKSIPTVERGNFPNTPAGQLAFGREVAARDREVANRAWGWANTLHKERLAERTQAGIAQRQQDENAAKDQREQGRQQVKEKADNFDKTFQFHAGQVHDERKHWTDELGNLKAGHPAYLDKNDDLAEAERRANQQVAARQRHLNPGAAVPNSAAAGQPAPNPNAPQTTDPQAQEKANLDATLSRHSGIAPAQTAPANQAGQLGQQAGGVIGSVLTGQPGPQTVIGKNDVEPVYNAMHAEIAKATDPQVRRDLRSQLDQAGMILSAAHFQGRGLTSEEHARLRREFRGIAHPDMRAALLKLTGE